MYIEKLATLLVNAAYDVHTELGPGLLESTYQTCLFWELNTKGVAIEKEKPLPVVYKGNKLEAGYRIDLLLEKKIIVEIKSVEALLPVHLAQILTYMRLSDIQLGFLINFNVDRLKNGGIKRVANNYSL